MRRQPLVEEKMPMHTIRAPRRECRSDGKESRNRKGRAGTPCAVSHQKLVPDPKQLRQVVCVGCGEVWPSVPLLWYNIKRRQYRTDENLTSLLAPITLKSSTLLQGVSRRFHIRSNKDNKYHVTFAEGLKGVSEKLIEDTRTAISLNNRLRVRSVKSISTFRGSKTEVLIILELECCGEELARAISRLRSVCQMPQYSLHCTLGVLSSGASKMEGLLKALKGTELKLNWDHMVELGRTP